MAFKYCVYFLPVLAILLAGDVEVNPGPTLRRRRQCRMLYSMHGQPLFTCGPDYVFQDWLRARSPNYRFTKYVCIHSYTWYKLYM